MKNGISNSDAIYSSVLHDSALGAIRPSDNEYIMGDPMYHSSRLQDRSRISLKMKTCRKPSTQSKGRASACQSGSVLRNEQLANTGIRDSIVQRRSLLSGGTSSAIRSIAQMRSCCKSLINPVVWPEGPDVSGKLD